MDKYESLSNTKWECKYHAVFFPTYRRRTLYEQLRRHRWCGTKGKSAIHLARVYGERKRNFVGQHFWARLVLYGGSGTKRRGTRNCVRFREDLLDPDLFVRLQDVREAAWWWMLEYNEQRPHDALGALTPTEYPQQRARSSTFELSA